MTGRKIERRVTPPAAGAELVAHTGAVLGACGKPDGRRCPAGGMDEQPVQLLKGARAPAPATKGHPRRAGHEYGRAGAASVPLSCGALAGWRQVTARQRRARCDRALEVAALLRGRSARAAEVILACDDLNTHTIGALHEALGPAAARSLVRRPGLRRAPGHGSRLNVAANELSAMTRQCVAGRRFATIDGLRAGTAAWQQHTNDKQRGVDWQSRIDGARAKLKSLYPKSKA